MSDSYYDVAQICTNGHVVNAMAREVPQRNQKHCSECGAPTISACQSCGMAIRGYYHVPGVFGGYHYTKPGYCNNCGQPYPWTVAGLAAARELADELDGLSAQEQQQLKESFADLVTDTPKTPLAETRFKRLMKKAGKDAYSGMRSILIDVVSEAVKKSLFGA